MNLEVEILTPKALKDEDLEEMNTKRIIGKSLIEGMGDVAELPTEYKRFTLKLEQVEGHGDFDGKHTAIYLPYAVFLINMTYDKFSSIYEASMGTKIKKASDFIPIQGKNKQ